MDKGRIIEALAVMEKRFNGYPVAKDIIHDALHDYMDQKELTAANRAIVALSEALERIRLTGFVSTVDEKPHFIAAKSLKENAPAIEKARGG